MIRILATSLSGSEHIVIGKVVDKECIKFTSNSEAKEHLIRNGWTNLRFLVEEVENDGVIRRTWDNQSVTEHIEDVVSFTYLRGGPPAGKKLSKSDMNG